MPLSHYSDNGYMESSAASADAQEHRLDEEAVLAVLADLTEQIGPLAACRQVFDPKGQ